MNRMVRIACLLILSCAAAAAAEEPGRVRAAYTSIAIQMTPLYLMKELDLGKVRTRTGRVFSFPHFGFSLFFPYFTGTKLQLRLHSVLMQWIKLRPMDFRLAPVKKRMEEFLSKVLLFGD